MSSEPCCNAAHSAVRGKTAGSEHVAIVGALLPEALKFAPITRVEVHGAAEELAKLRAPLSQFNPTYYTLLYGMRR